MSKEILDQIKKLRAELKEARLKLFPYADSNRVCGASWDGFYLIGDEKSIKELDRLRSRSADVETYRRCFDENVKFEQEKREAAEQKYLDLIDEISDILKKD